MALSLQNNKGIYILFKSFQPKKNDVKAVYDLLN
jgi:hypothetical protein